MWISRRENVNLGTMAGGILKEKSTEYLITRLIIIAGALLVGYFGAKLIGQLYYNRLIQGSTLNQFQDQYQKQIDETNDAYKLAKLGMIFLKTNFPDLALRAFQRASVLDAGWRDGWLWRGYAELKLGQAKEALESLKTAEKLDPIYPKTYELLAIAYQQTGDEESARYAQEKLEYLGKTYPTKSKE